MMSPLAKELKSESERPMKLPSDAKAPKSADLWAAYIPSDQSPWNLRRVVHLHRRAGFAATWSEIQRDLK